MVHARSQEFWRTILKKLYFKAIQKHITKMLSVPPVRSLQASLWGYRVVQEQQIEEYLSQGLFEKATTTEEKLNLIGTEFWVATFLNGYESYANWRRTGYPRLTPASYQSSPNKGTIPLRFRYPTEEYSINEDNVAEAVNNQGEDKMSTAVWWDK
ncbi:MAG: SusD/RagB family nutrient-binding outer membrane lipoprotein [Parabacteroides sp.]